MKEKIMGKNNKDEGGEKKETSTSRLLEIVKGGRMREEQRLKTSAKGDRENKRSKMERENFKESRRDHEEEKDLGNEEVECRREMLERNMDGKQTMAHCRKRIAD